VQIGAMLLVLRIDVPGVELPRIVGEGLQEVGGGSRSQRFPVIGLVEEAGDAARLRIDGHPQELVLQRGPTRLQRRPGVPVGNCESAKRRGSAKRSLARKREGSERTRSGLERTT